MTLLARRLEISDQPLVDQLAVPTELRRRPLPGRTLGRRQRRRQRLAHRAAMHAVTLASALIDSHSRSRSRLICSNCSILEPTLRGLDPVLDEYATMRRRSDEVGPVEAVALGEVQTVVPTRLAASRVLSEVAQLP